MSRSPENIKHPTDESVRLRDRDVNTGQIGNNNGHEMHMIHWDAVEWAISRISSSFGSMLSTGANTVSLFFWPKYFPLFL